MPHAQGVEQAGAGASAAQPHSVRNDSRQRPGRKSYGRKDGKANVKTREWVIQKKEVQRKRGMVVRDDSKYTARRRSKPKF